MINAEHSMCFVRSWRARDRNAWIVQRGCYQMSSDDVYPKTMNTPLRSMTCKLQKYVIKISKKFYFTTKYLLVYPWLFITFFKYLNYSINQ